MTLQRGRELEPGGTLDCDVVICGGGAGGSMAARELASQGLDVVLLEEGDDHLPADFDQREEHMIPRLFAEMGGRRTDDLALLVLSGRGLGGSTIHNTNLCKRTAPEILTHWADELGIDGVGPNAMAPFFDEVESLLGVRPIDDARINANNRVLQRGLEALGWAGGRLSHNRDERCIGSGFCELGCAYDGKLNARRVLVPDALSRGARVITDARVERVRHRDSRVVGVDATLLDADGYPRGSLRVDAHAIALAGSAIGSAAIALRSALPDPHAQLGVGLRLHPGAAIAGLFDERLESWRGIPQSWDCTEHLDLRPGSDRRAWIVPSFAHPVGTAASMPGFGPDLMRSMRTYPNLAVLAAMVHDETAGRVYLDGDRIRIAYAPTRADREQLALGARGAARILLAAGAREVMVAGVPPITIRSERDVAQLDQSRFSPHDVPLTAVHPMGTLRMGADPRTSVVDAEGRHHQVRGLSVLDGSIFPTSIGTPPQLSIYAFALKFARALREGLT
ncbi:MAG: GMC family oxidoreductase [Myxococcota bacterium]|nr:GMC family oxidoreductase [Myxococcota bacterium]